MKKNNHKYIFVIGGVMSGVGKGVSTASFGTILKSKGFRVSLIKADPYLNVDAGTMNPTEHGEVFVLHNGLETDQDMGNYERFLNEDMPPENYMTNGMIFKYVIDKERALGYKGKCVEPVYHITEEILRRIEESVKKTKSDITVFEIGGTVGEYQNAIFLEAARILKLRHPDDVMVVLVSYLPVPNNLGEMKTKPTQNAVRQLNSYGLNADMIIARSEVMLDEKRKEKIAISTGVPARNVISAPDIDSIYEVPINFEKDGLSKQVLSFFKLAPRKKDLVEWRAMIKRMKSPKTEVKIAVVGKYFDTGDFTLSDAYISVIEALKFSAGAEKTKVTLSWVNAKKFETNTLPIESLKEYDGIIVPGGFGESGIEGKLMAIRFARENNIPYFGLCYGMQLAVIEYARNVLGIADANTGEIDPEGEHLVIDIMPDQKKKLEDGNYGGSMRLGVYPCVLKKGTVASEAYSDSKSYKLQAPSFKLINERHRHRYEVNNAYIEELEKAGLVFSGTSPDGTLMEIAELPRKTHPFFVGTQFHPEFLARPLAPHPLFTAFIKAALKRKT
ncbi:MAG: CTP synthase [Candidatus Taylorbacteria bacterium RIFCSPHIGHO2_01_FULL_45_63]|uniref:CTP synthase n=1 Tax=Candidatus Taylorbacteria bacterium RIFCSPHIGHO2_02_FULL_45_35 TaxID=1802311 RepID=A0A1G2MP75_9BACT|nr:MAG: CTP synthase [Candidatus Taylorbacteria bacterium RIFCSPHIGHO2_01_FULL_45_63]OHA25667.1 MAG: CTP synthase [Candidatus Taylorbacteria bacterium RIFCSPHIGHO2_02_FULL_45_35]OHA35075.1 MAG: CTP synthase [Candidatus Taylorbacteria bacterium RIFCSPLOWO2_01_FULL_45_34b]